MKFIFFFLTLLSLFVFTVEQNKAQCKNTYLRCIDQCLTKTDLLAMSCGKKCLESLESCLFGNGRR